MSTPARIGVQEPDEFHRGVDNPKHTDAVPPPRENDLSSAALESRRWTWWLRVAEVRFRLLALVALALLVVTQWAWLRHAWDRWMYSNHRPDVGSVSGNTEYFCPMDPGVLSAWPAICPICNMDLVQRKKHDAQLLPEGVVARMQLSPYRIQLAGIRTSIVEFEPSEKEDSRSVAAEPGAAAVDTSQGTESGDEVVANDSLLVVPESAVVDHGGIQLVFVESMPGTFDALPVTLGKRRGEYYSVLSGLQAGQKVASTGAFLLDAETRLNPSLAVAYFGANQSSSPSRIPEVRVARKTSSKTAPKLSPQQIELAKKQGKCPVTALPLDSMGGPVPVEVNGRTVFICCRGCEGKLRSDPEKYIAKVAPHD